MTTYAVITGNTRRTFDSATDQEVTDDLPVRVDEYTSVSLDSEHGIVIVQGSDVVDVFDPEALTLALAKALVIREERLTSDTRPMFPDQRKALFAALRDRYGKDLTRDDRLRKLSVLAGHRITSVSDRYGDMTRADFARVMDILNEL